MLSLQSKDTIVQATLQGGFLIYFVNFACYSIGVGKQRVKQKNTQNI